MTPEQKLEENKKVRREHWFFGIASERLAIEAFRLVDTGKIGTRTPLSDALEDWANERFNVSDGTGILKLREYVGENNV